MDTQKKYSCLERNDKVFCKNLDLESDFSEALPAYCDDIYRIVKCTSHSNITSININSPEITIYGKTEIAITYYNENSCLCYADFEEEFTKSVSVENLSDGAFAYADINDKYTNFRVINQRRIDVHSSASIQLSVFDKAKCPCISSCEGAKLKKETIKTADIIGTNISKIEFDEEFAIPSDSMPIKRIISSSSFATLIETKIIKDKVLVKALVSTNVLYTSDSENEELLKAQYSFSVSKIIDQAGIDENDIVVTNICIGNLFLKAKAASNDKLSVIDAFGDISIHSIFIRESENSFITDGYILKRNSTCSYSDFLCRRGGRFISDNRLVNLSLDFSGEIKEIKELNVSLTAPSSRNGRIVSRVDALLVYENESGSLASMSAGSDIELDADDASSAVAALSVQSMDYTLGSSGRVELRLNLCINAYLYNASNIKVLSEMDAADEEIDFPSLTVYFGKQNESVWNIAKTFSSDTDLIVKENALNSDVLDSNKVLIIPRV